MELHYIDRPLFQRMFGVAVREAREAYNLTLEQLHARTGISSARLIRIEEGRVWIRASAREALIKTLLISEERLDRMVSVARLGFIDLFHSSLVEQMEEEFTP